MVYVGRIGNGDGFIAALLSSTNPTEFLLAHEIRGKDFEFWSSPVVASDVAPHPEEPTKKGVFCYTGANAQKIPHKFRLKSHPRMNFIGRYNFRQPWKFDSTCRSFGFERDVCERSVESSVASSTLKSDHPDLVLPDGGDVDAFLEEVKLSGAENKEDLRDLASRRRLIARCSSSKLRSSPVVVQVIKDDEGNERRFKYIGNYKFNKNK